MSRMGSGMSKRRRHGRRSMGLSLVELLVALAISAALLAALMVAIDASFKAYASATEEASAQAATRMITQRLMTLVRTSTAHGPLEADADLNWPVVLNGTQLSCEYVELIDPDDNLVRIEYRDDDNELWYILEPGTVDEEAQPLLGGVTNADFFSNRRQNDDGIWVLERSTIDLTVLPDTDATMSIEGGNTAAIRVIASTMPRKLD